MIPFYIAELRQIETLFIAMTLLMIRCIFTKEDIFAIVPDTIRTPAWGIYFAFLWFGLFPYMNMKADWPHYGSMGIII